MNFRQKLSSNPLSLPVAVLLQILTVACFLVFVFETQATSNSFVSPQLREAIATSLGGTVQLRPQFGLVVTMSFAGSMIASLGVVIILNLLAVINERRRRWRKETATDLSQIVLANALWTLPLAIWCMFFLVLPEFAIPVVSFVLAATVGGWIYEMLRDVQPPVHSSPASDEPPRRPYNMLLTGLIAGFVVVFVSMNWGLWWNLRIPHGDSAMYEEHLWNIEHGKGFRSYLDQGLFLGEHIQVIHLLLVPLHLIWPSHLLLELCETLALGLGAVPTFYLAQHYSSQKKCGYFLAAAYLLYFPLHYLDIAIDLKTFRPISFGVPLMLWAIYAMEKKHWKRMAFALILALACKEDFAIVIAPLGLSLALREWFSAHKHSRPRSRPHIGIGLATCVLATIYLAFAVKVAIPYFRNWETVHYARYFEAFGESPTEIVWNMITRPSLLFERLITMNSFIYLLCMLLPLGLPLRAWQQLLVGIPLFVLLCLNELATDLPGPFHHFHAPLVPIVVWAACAVLEKKTTPVDQLNWSNWAYACSLSTAFFFSFYPFSLSFWDSGSSKYWQSLYVMDERAEQVANVLKQIPNDARVASTDYVHARLTHFERSYDYSKYPRAVANYEDKVPDDTDYIIIDRRHPYSRTEGYDDIEQIREIQREPEKWTVLPDQTNGYYFILKRRE